MAIRILLVRFCILALFFSAIAFGAINEHEYSSSDIITADVCIIGGGSSGTYSAIRLQQLGKSVALIEKKSRLGGHVNTFKDSVTGRTFDDGVILFDNISVVRNYFQLLDVPLARLDVSGAGITNLLVDFSRSRKVPNSDLPPANATAEAIIAFEEIEGKYSFLANGFDLPSPVPADLLLPFGDFMKKYSLEAIAHYMKDTAQGFGDLLAQPTLYLMIISQRLHLTDFSRTSTSRRRATTTRNCMTKR